MKNLVVIGGGTAGTLVANQLVEKVSTDWSVTVVDPDPVHLYQPGLVFLPFGVRDEPKMLRPREKTFRRGIHWLQRTVEEIDTDKRRVIVQNHDPIAYDLLILATGSRICPEETEGLTGEAWQRSIFDFYTLEGAQKLRDAMASFEEGRVVVNVVEMPIKCPVAPLEFLFLADAFFTKRGIRDRIELVYATPLDGAFTKPVASSLLGSMLEQKGVRVESEFNAGSVDAGARVLSSWDERKIPFDLLVTVPTHKGAEFIEATGFGDDLAFVPTEPATLKAKNFDNIFVLGDATDLPTSKAGSVAHFQGSVVVENVLRAMRGQSLSEGFDGHANCFVESGFGKALLIDFNYDVEPLPGKFPLPVLGPMSLLKESRLNHWGKLAFRWVYWNALLPGRPIPISERMSMAGKIQPDLAQTKSA